jgi:hypothetical protein
MWVHKFRWIFYTTFLIAMGTDMKRIIPIQLPYMNELTQQFIIPFFTSIAFLLPDILGYIGMPA